MGNCMETCCAPPVHDRGLVLDKGLEDRVPAHKSTEVCDADGDCGLQKGAPPPPGGKGGLKVKIVLTKAELEWLMLRLNEEKGGGVEGAALEQALEEIQKGRKRDGAGEKEDRSWKPSLERIMECPETQSFDADHLDR